MPALATTVFPAAVNVALSVDMSALFQSRELPFQLPMIPASAGPAAKNAALMKSALTNRTITTSFWENTKNRPPLDEFFRLRNMDRLHCQLDGAAGCLISGAGIGPGQLLRRRAGQ